MAQKTSARLVARLRRQKRTRSNISGTAERPRMTVSRSSRHVYVQVIDDVTGHTLASVSTFEKGTAKSDKSLANVEACATVGKRLAERCLAKKISKVVFDKGGNKYHGRIKAIADGAREGGLDF